MHSAPGGFYHQHAPPKIGPVPLSSLLSPLRLTQPSSSLPPSSHPYTLDDQDPPLSLDVPSSLIPDVGGPFTFGDLDIATTRQINRERDEDLNHERAILLRFPQSQVGPRIDDGSFEHVKRNQRASWTIHGRVGSVLATKDITAEELYSDEIGGFKGPLAGLGPMFTMATRSFGVGLHQGRREGAMGGVGRNDEDDARWILIRLTCDGVRDFWNLSLWHWLFWLQCIFFSRYLVKGPPLLIRSQSALIRSTASSLACSPLGLVAH